MNNNFEISGDEIQSAITRIRPRYKTMLKSLADSSNNKHIIRDIVPPIIKIMNFPVSVKDKNILEFKDCWQSDLVSAEKLKEQNIDWLCANNILEYLENVVFFDCLYLSNFYFTYCNRGVNKEFIIRIGLSLLDDKYFEFYCKTDITSNNFNNMINNVNSITELFDLLFKDIISNTINKYVYYMTKFEDIKFE